MISYSDTRSDLAFAGKQRFISKQAKENLKNVLNKMNSEALYVEHGDIFVSSTVSGLKINGKANLKDERFLTSQSNKIKGTTSLEFGRTNLKINNETGEIVKHKKSIFTTWSSILKKADDYINLALQNYDNKNVVNKRKITIEGFTQKGLKHLKEITKKSQK